MNFIIEQIELLWIIPVIALVLFIFIIQFAAQKKEQTGLSHEVAQFNNGALPLNQRSAGQGNERLNQLEKAILTITNSLTAQQEALNKVSKGSVDYSKEINDLKAKLHELYREYDIVLSENYSLKAKVKKLQVPAHESDGDTTSSVSENQSITPSDGKTEVLNPAKVDMKLYEDTRIINLTILDDTSEIDLSDLPQSST